MSEETVTFNLDLLVEQAADKSRKIELIIFRGLGLWNRMCRMLGLPADSPIVKVTAQIQRVVMTIRTLHTAVILLNAASGPIGWAMAGIGVGSAVMAMADTVTMIGE